MNNMNSPFGRIRGFNILRRAAVILVALLWTGPAFCGEIHDAAKNGNLEKVKALLEANPDLVSSRDEHGMTPLHWAAAGGSEVVAELLLASNAVINATDNGGATPLHYAAGMGHKYVAELLWRARPRSTPGPITASRLYTLRHSLVSKTSQNCC